MDHRTIQDVFEADDPRIAVETRTQNFIGCCDLLSNPTLDCCAREGRPQTVNSCPFFLKEGAERIIIKPKNTKVSIVLQRVFNQSYTLKIFAVQPIYVCMKVMSVAGTPVDITTIHTPQIRDDINIVL